MVPQCRAGMNKYEKNKDVTQPFVDGDVSLKQIVVTMNEIGEHEQVKERYRDAGGRGHETASHWQGEQQRIKGKMGKSGGYFLPIRQVFNQSWQYLSNAPDQPRCE